VCKDGFCCSHLKKSAAEKTKQPNSKQAPPLTTQANNTKHISKAQQDSATFFAEM
jgi:hypothetical protein